LRMVHQNTQSFLGVFFVCAVRVRSPTGFARGACDDALRTLFLKL